MAKDYHFRNLVFEGGGVKGIAYGGAMQVLDEMGILPDIVRVGGTSAGAINAVLLATGHTPAETRDVLHAMEFEKFLDGSWGLLGNTLRLLRKYGWYKGDYFRAWMANIIGSKGIDPEATFADFKKLGLMGIYLVSSNVSTGFSNVLSAKTTPDLAVADAARMSMSLPFLFAAIRSSNGAVYVDGGVLRNYPIKLFDRAIYIQKEHQDKHSSATHYYRAVNSRKHEKSSPYIYNKQTLGFNLDTLNEIEMYEEGASPPVSRIKNFLTFNKRLLHTVLDAQANAHLHSDDWQRTIYLDSLGIRTTEFNLSDQQRDALMESGAKGVRSYFEWYDSAAPHELPANHPEFIYG